VPTQRGYRVAHRNALFLALGFVLSAGAAWAALADRTSLAIDFGVLAAFSLYAVETGPRDRASWVPWLHQDLPRNFVIAAMGFALMALGATAFGSTARLVVAWTLLAIILGWWLLTARATDSA
jgi:hypothetical protein